MASAIELRRQRDAKNRSKKESKRLNLDRPINDEDIWVIKIDCEQSRFIGGITALNCQFEKQNNTYNCKVQMRFIKKSGRNCEKFE